MSIAPFFLFQVTLSWKRPTVYSEAAIVGYKVLKDGCQYGAVLRASVLRFTVKSLEAGEVDSSEPVGDKVCER